MNALPEIEPKYRACYEDPRTTPGFPAEYYPAEPDGEATVFENVQQAKGRFKAVYARRNACVRALRGLNAGDPGRPQLIAQILFLTEAIDHLEDVYAPIGLIAEPVMDDTMFACELVFTHARAPSPKSETFESSFSLYIPIPLADTQEEEDPNGT